MPQSPEAMALSTHSTGTPPNTRVSLSTHCLASSSEAQSRVAGSGNLRWRFVPLPFGPTLAADGPC